MKFCKCKYAYVFLSAKWSAFDQGSNLLWCAEKWVGKATRQGGQSDSFLHGAFLVFFVGLVVFAVVGLITVRRVRGGR